MALALGRTLSPFRSYGFIVNEPSSTPRRTGEPALSCLTQLCVGHAKDDRDNQADEQDNAAAERVRPQVD
jgi:hypothetical protein